jgi:hypothetical protein
VLLGDGKGNFAQGARIWLFKNTLESMCYAF